MKAPPASRIHYLIRRLKKSHFTVTLACLGLLVIITVMARAPFSRAQTSEAISTFANDCGTPKSIFNIGDDVCAVVTGALLGSPAEGVPVQRRFQWVTPDGNIFKSGPDITSDPQSDSITIPATGSSAQVGTWMVMTVDASSNGQAVTRFTVVDPNNDAVDLWTPIFAPFQVSAGSSAPFSVFLTNKGPNEAQNVQLVVTVATNSTFQSETQVSGPAFNCTNPTGSTGTSTCTIASLPANTTAQFVFVYQIDSGAQGGTVVSVTATVTSDTAELFAVDNTFTASVTIPPDTASTCDVTCPSDITTTKTAGQCGATVTFSASSTGSDCGNVVCTPPSGTFFPLGTSSVICLGETGGPCVFNVIVEDPQPPSITCPANVTVNESSPGFGLAVVHFPAPTLNDNCPAGISDCSPPSGSSFPLGTTTVMCQTGGPGNTVTCSFTVTVNGEGGGGCTITCPGDITQSASAGQCSAAVTFSPVTSGTCGTVACSPPSGSVFPIGTTLVNCTTSQGPSCDFTVTVLASAAPTITTCATDKTVFVTANCEAAIPNLLGEVVASGCSVNISQSPAAGALVGPGVYTVTITAENSAGEATCTAIVTVRENFTGFFSPVNNLPVLNVVNAGRSIPVKFSLNGYKGMDIFDPGFPASGQIACDNSAPPAEITETVTAGNSSLSYDPSTDQYIYVWKTENSWAGTCRQLIIRLKDGCVHRANFRFR
ncbi:MAG TPA: PxKF domain-containing protein [Blastocatellia bacterium]